MYKFPENFRLADNVHLVPVQPLRKQDNVGIYCRVSTYERKQMKSLMAQISALTRMVGAVEQWNLYDTYIDVASAKSKAPREDFERMLKDSEAKKIQIVITKSISRFGRDTVDALEALRRLKAAGTRVMFIEENLDTAEDDSEFMISVLESFAQDENEARSQNIRWGLKSRAEQGSSKLYNRKCYGYKQDENDKIVVDEDEAETVRKIFAWYLEGCSILGILKKLEESGTKSPTGKDKWCKRTIDVMLQNEKYRGDVRLHNPLSKETDIMMFDGCPPIVTKEQFQAVQDERTRRSNVICDDNGRRRKSTKFSSKRKDDAGMDLDYIKDGKQMEFAIFCIENTAVREGIDAEAMYELLAVKSDILQSYIVPNYEIFHTQGKDYIVDDILDVMKERGVTV